MSVLRRAGVVSFFAFLVALLVAIIFHPQKHMVDESEYGPRDVIGIDFGETESRVGIIRNNAFELILDEQGRSTFPSYVTFMSKGTYLVGHAAKEHAESNPNNTIYGFRNLIGGNFSDLEVGNEFEFLPYNVIEISGRPVLKIQVNGTDIFFSPEELSSAILENLKGIAEGFLNRTVTNAVITVPSHFNDEQREAVRDAATNAGLNTLRVLGKSIAASLSHRLDTPRRDKGSDKCKECNFVIYHFNERSSELVLQRIDFPGAKFTTLAMKRDVDFGGNDFRNILPSALGAQRVLREGKGKSVNRAVDLVKQLLDSAKTDKIEINGIVFTGNPEDVATIQPVVEAYFDGINALSIKGVSSDEVIVRGAAMQGDNLSYVGGCRGLTWDTTYLSLGIETTGGSFTKVIPRGWSIPTVKTVMISTAMDNQEKIVVKVLEGERGLADQNRLLGTFELMGLPLRSKGVVRLMVFFEMDSEEILRVGVRDMESGRETRIVITETSMDRYTYDEIDAIVKEGEDKLSEDAVQLQKEPSEGNEREYGVIIVS